MTERVSFTFDIARLEAERRALDRRQCELNSELQEVQQQIEGLDELLFMLRGGVCPNCKGVGHRSEANGEQLACDLCDQGGQ